MAFPAKIFLIGLPGSGKSTLGVRLSNKLAYPYFDLDNVIETMEGRKIAEIFEADGEMYFRKKEREALQQVLQTTEPYILSTGGGTPCFYDNMAIINQTGFSIFIKTPIATIVDRLSRKNDRPLLQYESREELTSRISGLLKERLPFYSQAHAVVESNSMEAILAAIKN